MTVPELLKRSLRKDRLAHAYLIYGQAPLTHRSMVQRFFRSILCRQAPSDEACEQCRDCTWVEAWTHPDVVVLEEDGSRGASASIGVQRVREEIVNRATLTPVRGRYKLFWLPDLSWLTPSASHTLLKVLEEPPGEAVFLLGSRTRREVLPTIRSRCQWIRLPRTRGRPESPEDAYRRLWPDGEQTGQELEDWIDLMEGKQRTLQLSWNRKRARKFLSFLLILVHQNTLDPARVRNAVSDRIRDRLSWNLVPEITERLDELDRYANPVTVVNSLLEELYYPKESLPWRDVI